MLPPEVIEKIEKMVDKLFDDLKGRYLGPHTVGKRMIIGYMRDFSLPGIYQEALISDGGNFDEEILESLISTAGNYIESHRAKAKAEVVKAIVAFLTKQRVTGNVDPDELFEEMQTELDKQWKKVTHSVQRVIDTENSQARGVGLLSGVVQASIASGQTDPVVFWIPTKDHKLCDECRRLHLMPDNITPRLWYLSEVSHAYHVKGENFPSIGGLHPHCRCLYDGNSPVVTESGVKPLKDVEVGDYVLTHTGKFKRVLGTFGREGLPPSEDDAVYRIEFRSPDGKLRKLRVTGDHLMQTPSGWVRADQLTANDSLMYLFKKCQGCEKPFAHDINKPHHRFCSIQCVGRYNAGKPSPTKGRKVPGDERERRRQSIIKAYEKKREGRPESVTKECEHCKEEYSVAWKFRNTPRKYCSMSCRSKVIARSQWSDPKHRKNISKKNRKSMLQQYANGDRRPEDVAVARRALYAQGRVSSGQRKLYDLVKAEYEDAVLEGDPIGPYFPDITIPSVKTVVEYDGGGHWMDVYKGNKTMEEKLKEDRDRDDYMRSQGWHVIRIDDDTLDNALADIRRVALNSTGGYSFQPVTIERVVRIPPSKRSKMARLYDITVEDDASFVIMGVVSHNCTLTTLQPGFGFDARGKIKWVKKDHMEIEHQRGLAKAEQLLIDSTAPSHEEVCDDCRSFEGTDFRESLRTT